MFSSRYFVEPRSGVSLTVFERPQRMVSIASGLEASA
jgi:hypothetical protein